MPSDGWQLQCQSDEEYEKNVAYYQRRNELLMAMEQIGCFESIGGQVCFQTPSDCFWSATDLRIIADELDRRNKQ